MKKFVTIRGAAVLFFALLFTALSLVPVLAGSTKSLFGDVITVSYSGGYVTVKVEGNFTATDWIGIYKKGETPGTDANGVSTASIIWWYIGKFGSEVTYPEENPGEKVVAGRTVETVDGKKNSPLKPGTYEVIAMVEDGYNIMPGTERIEFTVTEEDIAAMTTKVKETEAVPDTETVSDTEAATAAETPETEETGEATTGTQAGSGTAEENEVSGSPETEKFPEAENSSVPEVSSIAEETPGGKKEDGGGCSSFAPAGILAAVLPAIAVCLKKKE